MYFCKEGNAERTDIDAVIVQDFFGSQGNTLRTLLGSPHLTDRSVLVLGTSLAVLGFPDYSLWKASLSSTCVQPAKTISTTLLQNKKWFHCGTRFVGTSDNSFHENAQSTNKESFHYYLYVAHTCVQPENAISPAVWPTNIFLAISFCVSNNSKPSVTVDVQFCFSFSFQNTKLNTWKRSLRCP